jgi:GNAT superfamily N-acetyltransferase
MQDYFLAVAEPIAAMGSGIIAEPVAGFAGLAAAPFGSDAAANAVNYYRDQLTYSPRSEAGQSGMAAVGEAMAPIGEAMDYAASGAGDYIYDKTGSPALAAAAYSAPTAALELLGLKGVNQLSKSGKLGQPLEFGDIGSGGVGSKQRGIFAGVKAKGADLKRQAAAEELAKRGVGRDQIWKDTGWFNDVDGNWKFEIDDSLNEELGLGADIDPSQFKQLKEYGGIPQPQLLPHQRLYEAYPDAKDIRVQPIDGSKAYYNPRTDQIGIGSELLDDGSARAVSAAESANLHELQHAIQEREGFAKGGNLDSFDKIDPVAVRQAETVKGWIEATGMSADELMKGKPPAGLGNEWLKSTKPWAERPEFLAKMKEDAYFGANPFESYQRLAGEAEARNVQTRMDYTPEQRQAAAPWTTLDVPESELIVRGNSNGPMMSSGNDIKSAIRESEGAITLDKVIVPESVRDKGLGTKFMKDLIGRADQSGKRIELTPSADFGGNKNRLVKFYKRLGFVENKGKNRDYEISESMYRLPE